MARYVSGGTSDIKTVNTLAAADIKTFLNIPRAGIKTINALTMGGGAGAFEPDDIAGLQAWYKADEGVYSQSAAQFVKANSEYLSIPTNSSLRTAVGTPMTIGGWYYIGTPTGTDMLISKTVDGAVLDYQLYNSSVGLGVLFQLGGAGYPFVMVPPGAVGAWHFVIASYDPAGGGVAALQIDNGTPNTVVAGVMPDSATGGVLLGAHTWASPGDVWDGRLQNWFQFGRLLNSTERSFLYNSGNGRSYEELDSAFKTDLRAWWPLDEPSGSRRDLSGNGNALTDNNTVTEADGKVLNPAANNSRIYRWNDQSGNGRHVQALGTVMTDRPLYLTAAQNGLPVLQCYGPSIGAFERLLWSGTMTAGSVFTALEWQGGLPVPAIYYGYLSSSSLIYWSPHPTNPWWYTAGTTAFPPTGYYLDGVATTNMANGWHGYATLGTPVVTADLWMFDDRAIGRCWHGRSGEIIIYDTQLSPANQAAVEAYLRSKWGLP